jgi:hypothetical protein
MDFETIEPALLLLVASATGVEASCVLFENAPRVRHNGQLALLSWVSTGNVGGATDEERWAYVSNANPLQEMRVTLAGPRELRLQVSVETLDQRPGYTARALAERARARFAAPSARAALEAVGLAFVRATEVTRADYRVDGRVVPRSLFEAQMNGAASFEDTDARTSYIATVGVTATVKRPDGSTVSPSSLQPTTGDA